MLLLKTVIEVLEVAGLVAGRKLSLVHGQSGPTLYMKETICNNNEVVMLDSLRLQAGLRED